MSAYGRMLGSMAILAAGLLTLGSCSNDGVTDPQASQPTGPSAPGEAGGVQASVSVGPFQSGEQVVRVRVVGQDLALGSYQGRLQFDPAVLSLVEVVSRDGTQPAGEFHVVNAEGADAGEIRFAGFAAQGFAGAEMVTLRFRVKQAITPGEVTLEFDVAGTLEGEAVPKPQLSVLRGTFVQVERQEER